jgi:hypothetical protein
VVLTVWVPEAAEQRYLVAEVVGIVGVEVLLQQQLDRHLRPPPDPAEHLAKRACREREHRGSKHTQAASQSATHQTVHWTARGQRLKQNDTQESGVTYTAKYRRALPTRQLAQADDSQLTNPDSDAQLDLRKVDVPLWEGQQLPLLHQRSPLGGAPERLVGGWAGGALGLLGLAWGLAAQAGSLAGGSHWSHGAGVRGGAARPRKGWHHLGFRRSAQEGPGRGLARKRSRQGVESRGQGRGGAVVNAQAVEAVQIRLLPGGGGTPKQGGAAAPGTALREGREDRPEEKETGRKATARHWEREVFNTLQESTKRYSVHGWQNENAGRSPLNKHAMILFLHKEISVCHRNECLQHK